MPTLENRIREKIESVNWDDLFDEKDDTFDSVKLKDSLQEVIEDFFGARKKKLFQQKKSDMFVGKWNSDLGRLNLLLKRSEDDEDDEERKENVFFKWNQLVKQEIDMWILISSDYGGKITLGDFNYVCERRGFDKYMIDYLKECLDYLSIEIVKDILEEDISKKLI